MILTLISAALRVVRLGAHEPQRAAIGTVAAELRALDLPQAPLPTSSR